MALFWELHGWPRQTKTRDGFSGVRKVECVWNDREVVQSFFLTWPRPVWPYGPSFGALAVSVLIEGFGKSGTEARDETRNHYQKAHLTIQFRSPNLGDEQPNPNAPLNEAQAISEQILPSAETLPLRAEDFKWKGDGAELKEGEDPIRVVKRGIYELTRYNLPTYPVEAYTYIGSINAAQVKMILLPTMIFPPQTLLFEPADVATHVTAVGQRLFNAKYRLAFRDVSWRKHWRTDTQAYDSMIVTASGADYNVPETKDFNTFLPLGS